MMQVDYDAHGREVTAWHRYWLKARRGGHLFRAQVPIDTSGGPYPATLRGLELVEPSPARIIYQTTFAAEVPSSDVFSLEVIDGFMAKMRRVVKDTAAVPADMWVDGGMG